MKKWVCRVCGYVHIGDEPPAVCPVCGVGPEEFEPAGEAEAPAAAPPAPAAAGIKQWKCVVCDYVHTGDEPPEVCPVCGVGRDQFVLLEVKSVVLTEEAVAAASEATARAALDKISYGLYVVSSRLGDRMNGQCANSVIQLTNTPPRIAVCLNKNNLTHEFVKASGVVAVSVLRQEALATVGHFGFSSGRNKDKFAGVDYVPGRNGCPVLKECVAYIEGQVIPGMSSDVGTHTLFVCDVTGGGVAEDCEALTYTYYRRAKTK